MKRVRYQVACSLDGFIAGPQDEVDWIPPEPSFDFAALHAQFDTFLMGRRTYEVARSMNESFKGKRVVVASRSLRAEDHPNIEVVGEGLERRVRELRGESGLDVWLYGGGRLFAQLLAWDLVDTVELAILPVLLGGGVPFLPHTAARRRLELQEAPGLSEWDGHDGVCGHTRGRIGGEGCLLGSDRACPDRSTGQRRARTSTASACRWCRSPTTTNSSCRGQRRGSGVGSACTARPRPGILLARLGSKDLWRHDILFRSSGATVPPHRHPDYRAASGRTAPA